MHLFLKKCHLESGLYQRDEDRPPRIFCQSDKCPCPREKKKLDLPGVSLKTPRFGVSKTHKKRCFFFCAQAPRRPDSARFRPQFTIKPPFSIKSEFLNQVSHVGPTAGWFRRNSQLASPHPTAKPKLGWLRIVARKLRLVLFELDRTGNKVTAKAKAYW